MRQNAPETGDLIPQMDIEGHEYDVLAKIEADILSRFRIIVVEFHGLYRLINRRVFNRFSQAIARLAPEFRAIQRAPLTV